MPARASVRPAACTISFHRDAKEIPPPPLQRRLEGRKPLERPRNRSAAGGSHAPKDARGVRWTGTPPGTGKIAQRGNRKGKRQLHGLLGTTRVGEDNARPTDRPVHRPRLRPLLGRDRGNPPCSRSGG